MKEFEQRRYFRGLFFSRPVFALFLAVLVLVGFSVFDMYKKSRQAVLRNEVVESELEAMKRRQEDMRANIADLETDIGIERELRGKLQVKKPGESYVVILDAEPSAAEERDKNKKSFFKKLMEFFDIF